MKNQANNTPYQPLPVTVGKVTVENDARDLKTLRLTFDRPEDARGFRFRCGQFAILSLPGQGECPIGIASSPEDGEYIEFTVKKYPHGLVSSALHRLEEGDRLGVRGPYGNHFPLEEMKGRNLVIVGGGFAFTTLRSTLRWLLLPENRSGFGDVTVVYGARNPGELLYKEELKSWSGRKDLALHVTVDKGDEGWNGREGFVPTVLGDVAPSASDACALVCGPPLMLKFTIPVLKKLGFPDERILTSVERKMTCGIGKCGRCNIGPKYVCKHGPIFTFAELGALLENVF
jgi:sulfhydrogenase subunit gamma (sulfur reductase)